jgi:hypothetical protein
MLLVSCTWILILSPSPNAYFIVSLPTQLAKALFGWLVASQPAVLFSHTSSASATSHQPASSIFLSQ